MISQNRILGLFCALLAVAIVGVQPAPARAAEKPKVAVDWTDPSKFTEMQNRSALIHSNPEVWLEDFASTIRRRAPRVLKTGQSLSVTITDVTLAGTVESGRGAVGVRVVDQNSPPRIKLRFTLTGANGQIIDSGDRNLSNPDFMSPNIPDNDNPYLYEERLLTNWMDKEFGRHSK